MDGIDVISVVGVDSIDNCLVFVGVPYEGARLKVTIREFQQPNGIFIDGVHCDVFRRAPSHARSTTKTIAVGVNNIIAAYQFIGCGLGQRQPGFREPINFAFVAVGDFRQLAV